MISPEPMLKNGKPILKTYKVNQKHSQRKRAQPIKTTANRNARQKL